MTAWLVWLVIALSVLGAGAMLLLLWALCAAAKTADDRIENQNQGGTK